MQQEEFCATVLATVEALVMVLDPHGRIVGFNRACEDVSGYTFDDLRGQPFFDVFLAPDEASAVRQSFERLDTAQFPNTYEGDWRIKSGDVRRVSWRNAAIRDADGRVTYVVGTGIDITERCRIEQCIERAKQEWEATFDAVPDLVAVVGTDMRIVRVNRALADRLGCHPGDLVGKRCCETLHGLSGEPNWCLHKRLMATGKIEAVESREDRLDGDYRISITPLQDRDGALRGSVHVFRDITPLKQAEAARRREELGRLDRTRSLGLLSISLAHELNQPLAAIRCNAQTALRRIRDGDYPPIDELDEVLADIVTDDKRAAAIIDGMRAMLEGRSPPAETLRVPDVVREAEKLLQAEAAARAIRLSVAVPDTMPPVRAGRTPLLQVLLNLALNAFDAVSSGPRNRREVSIQTASEDGCIRIDVMDSGPGIAPDRIDAIFELLRTGKKNGLGMGLAISRSLIEAYGGTLHAGNRPDGGAVFTFTLPVAEEE